MPVAMKLLDKIAREKQQEVLFLPFRKKDLFLHPSENNEKNVDWDNM